MMPPRTSMGVATTSYLTAWKPQDPLEFLDHCHELGSGGIQTPLFQLDAAGRKTLRARAESYGMFVEVMAPLPTEDVEQFRSVLRAAKECGASVVRTGCLGGRRYETFSTMAEWKAFVAKSHDALRRALPILEQEKVTMALENHKDWTREEFLALLGQFQSPNLGVCIDLGNNVSLLDDPYEIVEALAPYAASTHVKDMAWEAAPNGFLMSEVPMGEGSLDLKRMIATIRKAKPNVRIVLEMITRDPLFVPCLTPKYWATMPERKASDLARTLSMVNTQKSRLALPRTTGQDRRQIIRMEVDAVKICLAYAREVLGLTLQ